MSPSHIRSSEAPAEFEIRQPTEFPGGAADASETRVRLAAIGGVMPASRMADRPPAPTVSFGVAAVDALTGGLPRGALSELCGPVSSGRTSVLLAAMAEATRRQELCALVDVTDSLDPQSASAAGVDLDHLLWIRCTGPRVIGDWRLANEAGLAPRGKQSPGNRQSPITNRQWSKSRFARLDQALKATDLLLQAGGFGMVVVDLADVPSQVARRIPLTSWFRFRRAAENTLTVLLVVEEEPYAKTCASLVVRLSRVNRQSPAEDKEPPHVRVLHGLEIEAEILRSPTSRKPSRSATAEFGSKTAWRIA